MNDVAEAARVIRLLHLRKRVGWIADTYSIPRAHIEAAGAAVGLRVDSATDTMTALSAAITDRRPEPVLAPVRVLPRFTMPDRRPRPPSAAAALPPLFSFLFQERPMETPTGPADASSLSYLLEITAAHTDKTTQRIRSRIIALVADLRARAIEVEAEEGRARQAEREKATLRAKADKLRAELRALDEQLGKKPKHASTTTGAAGDAPPAAAVRAWALANNVYCSEHGQVPRTAVDAYIRAHTPTGDVA